ncbi:MULTISPECIES: hypothetical protein [Cyanophyceae]|uniref:hypothetical protein n=1 Tax=Cyanophyceae TaxID=3028117 RepID=UPI001686FCD0|nr:hypothetical protein [Trichocoleus sp. FACHB-40]MBD2005632.1 hypothetical protein [Trichocoleus sp. FACHB-40]
MIYRPDDELPPIEELLELAEVSEDTVAQAVEAWESNPADEDFKLIFRAETEADE